MQTMLEQNRIAERVITRTIGTFGKKIGLVGKLFGCWHKLLSRPFTSKENSYRVCLDCGARAEFDTQNFKTKGTFYYPPAVAFDLNRTIS
ncbi:hypothetical protein BH20ACI2_BH20ACI2_19040 [soil metagenome]